MIRTGAARPTASSHFLQQPLPQLSHVQDPLQHAQLHPSLPQGHVPVQPHAPVVVPQGQSVPHIALAAGQLQEVSSQQPASVWHTQLSSQRQPPSLWQQALVHLHCIAKDVCLRGESLPVSESTCTGLRAKANV